MKKGTKIVTSILLLILLSTLFVGCTDSSNSNNLDNNGNPIVIEFVRVTIHTVKCTSSMDDWSSPDIFVIIKVDDDSERSGTYEDRTSVNMEFFAVFSTSAVTKVEIELWDEDVSENDWIGGFYTWTEGIVYGTKTGSGYEVTYSIEYF